MALKQQQMEQQKLELEKQKRSAAVEFIQEGDRVVCVRRRADAPAPLQHLLSNHNILNMMKEDTNTQKQPEVRTKQTWEQALAHINQLAKGTQKKKQKEEKQAKQEAKRAAEAKKAAEAKPKPPPVEETPPLSKKQRKALAKQQAEEEERKRQQQEQQQKNKKTEAKKAEPAKAEPKKADKKKEPEAKKPEPAKKKEEKKDKKAEKKGKENKQEKNTPAPAPKQKQPQPQPEPSKKKEKKKQQAAEQPKVINITQDTTLEVVNKKNQCNNEPEKPASCSIMEQLSSGVQVADLRLPPGITLTRVQPTEKKEAPSIKSVPLWKCGALAATPTPVARPPPVIHADPSMMMFAHHQPEPPKPIIVPEPPPPAPAVKSKKAKKKAKKAATEEPKPDAKMVTLRNPMFHPNLPPVQVTSAPVQKKTEQIRIPDPIPMPPTPCQATITPTSNGMYTIRNPLMSMMHQQSLMGMRPQTPQVNPMYNPQFNYVNPNVYNPVQTVPNQYMERTSPKQDEFQNRIMNLASFTQKNDEGYSLFKTNDDHHQRSFLSPEYYVDNASPKPVVSPNPIGTRPNNESNRSFDSNDSSLFANPIQRPEPIGTPLKRDEERNDFTGLYTPFGHEDRNVFRSALFSDKCDIGGNAGKFDDVANHMANGDSLPYFQRLRVGSKLNNEVTIHHVTESKFYKGQEPIEGESLFSRMHSGWPAPAPLSNNNNIGHPHQSGRSSPTGSSLCSSSAGASAEDDAPFGAVGTRHATVHAHAGSHVG
ncbi:pollen-specific leucine-rich repeat extensin-like protein 1 isoform X1 [Ostrinia furnacalis]|uniref:pollen-specific leucine-rich repeat extensin-like protein 1 isoform X1 n=1 Tax=Ostrinia furnacalis TaxID=93504 RepID=UPI00103D85FD|nr:pollen-specific leucine-rich repeat extensin-like protein 1 isoform X1 [Ostrinia furnacalis]XP_028158470.1 pollen-specific leucine-rich repeat extensin-like protein 1 isoform X1 [Ostrinia furnacalis]XP_028158471.1 pollen-specific leucine-rich repeat extensin-like protein 1 isoform X1 [Ostrinia furnacalis]XP_028158472.1 pollen-specific leucine-rich repeat extensin-like protein 1 isoform X1 [Ostrinia furnacalis]